MAWHLGSYLQYRCACETDESVSSRDTPRKWSMGLNLALSLAHVVLGASLGLAQSISRSSPILVTDEAGLRGLAKNIVMPKYPEDAIHNKLTGVAVATVGLDAQRHVAMVDVLQAPSASIAKSMSQAIFGSTFYPDKDAASPRGLRAHLTFYFLYLNKHFVVLNPEDTPKFEQILSAESPH